MTDRPQTIEEKVATLPEEARVDDVRKIVQGERVTHAAASLSGPRTVPIAKAPTPTSKIENALEEDRVIIAVHGYRSLYADLQDPNPLISELKGIEAFVRVIDTNGEIVRAGELIRGASTKPGLTHQIDLRVLREAVRFIIVANKVREALSLSPIPVSVNCSQDSISQPNFAKGVLDTFTAEGLDPKLCVIEILEEVVELDAQQLEEFKKLSDAGVQIALDDFDQRANGEIKDPVLSKLQKSGTPISELKVDGKTTREVITPEGFERCKQLVRIALEKAIPKIIWEVGYNKATLKWQTELQKLEAEFREKPIKFLFEGIIDKKPKKVPMAQPNDNEVGVPALNMELPRTGYEEQNDEELDTATSNV